MDESRIASLTQFTTWARQHITGDEKGQAQVFLDRLFQAFGQRGVHEAGASFEFRLKNTKGGTAFADLVWKPKVLIEMKKRGANLADHLQQAFDYWTRLVPGRPRYVVLCNFDEFRIYDFDVDLSEPQDTVKLTELPEHYKALAFLFPTEEPPQFKIDRVKVTRAAAAKLAAVYNRLENKAGVGPETAQRFILQILVALFSEDIGFLPKGFVTQLLDECTDPPKSFDLLNGLFSAMNSREVKGGRFKVVPYFNGGLFAHSAAIELDPSSEGALLRAAAGEFNWKYVSPDIFGTLFQHSMGKDQRHAFGAHYTSPVDIMKIVKPTIVDPFRAAIDAADSLKALAAIRRRLQTLRVLDPACGSGNFLYIAYREMRRLEAAINTRENEISKRQHDAQMSLSGVSPTQFFGLDILPFAVELAKVTLAIAPKLASDELHTSEPTLPLANLDNNIQRRDALIDDLGNPAQWPPADVIIGNPPFLGAKRLKPEHGPDYVNKVRKAYPQVPGMADYCVYWFRKAHDHLPIITPQDHFTGRAGLVGTQNIRNNQSRVGGLDHIVKSGIIHDAVESQPWSGEANVHVSIANWVKVASSEPQPASEDEAVNIPMPAPGPSMATIKALEAEKAERAKSYMPPPGAIFTRKNTRIVDEPAVGVTKKQLWSKVQPTGSTKSRSKGARADKEFEIASREVTSISPTLSDQADASGAIPLRANTNPKRVFQGITPGHDGFVLSGSEYSGLVKGDPKSKKVIHPYLIGRELVTGDGTPERYVIDFEQMTVLDAQAYPQAFERVKRMVLPDVQEKAHKEAKGENARKSHLERWWLHWRGRADRLAASKSLRGRCIACSRVTKRPIFVFIDTDIRPSDVVQNFMFDDDYSFGILQSSAHWLWFVTNCSKLTERLRYTADTVFDTFPWPQSHTKKQITAVASAAVELRHVRSSALSNLKGGLRALYRTLELPGQSPLKDAHAALDSAVLAAYGFSPKQDLLAQLLSLNHEVSALEKAGKPVTPPGVPHSYGSPSSLITNDCIHP